MLSAAALLGFSHVHAVMSGPQASLFNHYHILNGTHEDPVSYRILLPFLVDFLSVRLAGSYEINAMLLHLLFGALAWAGWAYCTYLLVLRFVRIETALIVAMFFTLSSSVIVLIRPNLVAYSPVEALFLTWGLLLIHSRW